MLWLAATTTLSLSACSNEDDPIEEDEVTFIEVTKPANLQVGMIYPISHDKQTDKCIFGVYLGENPPQEMIESLESQTVDVKTYDRYGQPYKTKYDGWLYDVNTQTYVDGFNTFNPEKMRREFHHENTLKFSCANCEIITKYKITCEGGTLLKYYPEMAEWENVSIDYIAWPEEQKGEVMSITITQSWSSPHHFYF